MIKLKLILSVLRPIHKIGRELSRLNDSIDRVIYHLNIPPIPTVQMTEEPTAYEPVDEEQAAIDEIIAHHNRHKPKE